MERMLEVTKLNYEKGIEELISLVDAADFIAVDATIETTGLVMASEDWKPTIDEQDFRNQFGAWYDEIKTTERSAFLLEVGVAFFKRLPNSPNVLEAESFNIPILPACIDDNEIARFRGAPGPRLVIDGYGKEFIEHKKFDINKTFYLGAPYLNQNLEKTGNDYMVRNPTFMIAPRKRRPNPFLMPQLIAMVSEEDREVILNRLRGVSKIFERISQSRKTVVGHHMFLKTMFIYKDFFRFLPDTYPEYCVRKKETFPRVVDTKALAAKLLQLDSLEAEEKGFLKDTRLYSLFRALNSPDFLRNRDQEPFDVIISSRSEPFLLDLFDLIDQIILEEVPQSFCYVAGFDALLSGVLFLDLVKLMELNKVPVTCASTWTSTSEFGDLLQLFIEAGAEAQLYLNRLFGEVEVNVPGPLERSPQVIRKKHMWFKLEMAEKKKKRDRQRPLRMLVFENIVINT